MYKVGDYVVSKNSGVCQIIDRKTLDFGGGENEYFILKQYNPKDPDAGMTLYVRVESDDGECAIRPILTKKEVDALIETMPSLDDSWIVDPKARKLKFEEAYKGGNLEELCQVIQMIHLHGEELKKNKKMLNMTDKEMFKKIQKTLYQEFSIALGIGRDEIDDYIEKRLKK